MHEINLWDETHYYTDASGFEGGMIITQKKIDFHFSSDFHISTKIIEVSIVYDSFTFISIQRKYPTYKKKLCAMIKLIIKYSHFVKHPYNTAIIHTDHKPFIYFLTFNIHENIYGH